MRTTSVKKSDLIIATSLLCKVCYHRDEQCEPLKISYFKKLGRPKGASKKVLKPAAHHSTIVTMMADNKSMAAICRKIKVHRY